MINIDSDHLLATLCKLAREQALAASHIKGAPAVHRNRMQYDIVIVNVVVPRTLGYG